MPTTEEEHALAGVRVLDLTGGVAGAIAGMLLADLGADAVKVHPPGPVSLAGQRGLAMWDRGKRAATADPSSAEDLLVLDRLIAGADVLLVGTSGPGITYHGLMDRGRRPGAPCFWVVMPPYLLEETPWPGGQESAGLLFAWLGHAWNQSSYADVPVDCLFPLALHMQGIWAATVAVALLTGRQRGLTLAPLAVAGGAHGAQLVSPGNFTAGRDEPHIHRPGGPGGALPNYRTYRCRDGQWLFLGAFTNAFIERGLTAAGAGWIFEDPRVGGQPGNLRLPENVTWIARELEKVFATRSRDEWLDLLEAADCPAAPVNEPGTWLDHDQVRALGLRLEAVSDTGQEIVMPGPLIDLSLTPVKVRAPAVSSWPEITLLQPLWSEAGTSEAGASEAGASEAGASEAGTSAQRQPGGQPSPAPRESEPQQPLSGLRVLDLGTIIAGPYVGSLLADLGADVIKIERPPLGDEFRVAHGGRGGSSFDVYNRDQRSAMLDLSPGDDRLTFDRLIGSADVVVDNYRIGVASRLGITHDQLAAINPEIVTVSISAFGDIGPLGRRPGFDPVIQAMSGIMRAQGGPVQADSPAFLTVPVNDVLAAGLGALGACAALLARTRLGRGQHVGVTLCAASCLLQSEFLAQFDGSSTCPAGGRDFAGPGPLDRLYQTSDGWVRLAASPGQLPALTGAGLAPAPGRTESGDEAVAAGISALLAGLPAAEVIARAHVAGIPAVRARQAQELTADAQLIRHGLLTVLDRDDRGVTRVDPGRWLEMPGLPAREPRSAPRAGEHTEMIRREAGLGGAVGRVMEGGHPVNLDLFRLQVFVTVVDRGGYSAAARQLNLTQSTVSHHVSELERACGAELVLYRDRSVHITAAGQEVYRAALSMLAEQDHLTASLADLKEGRRGRVRLGASMAFEQKYFFGQVIAPFCRAHRGTLLSLRFGHSRREAQAVLDRDLDLAYVIRWHLPAEARFEPLHEIELTFLASRRHPLAGGQPVSVDDIGAAGLITAPLTGAETGFYREALRGSGLTADHSVLEIDGQQARFLAAAAGLGVLATFVPDHARTAVFDDLVPLPVQGPLTRVEVGLVRPAGDPYSTSAQALAAWLRKPQPQ